tara:strand:- start:6257 stop:6439 length:183 start_codon:yes stop_codon:yes gene_type:complete
MKDKDRKIIIKTNYNGALNFHKAMEDYKKYIYFNEEWNDATTNIKDIEVINPEIVKGDDN